MRAIAVHDDPGWIFKSVTALSFNDIATIRRLCVGRIFGELLWIEVGHSSGVVVFNESRSKRFERLRKLG